eukprot:3045956-Prymnesium_polylepis.1
MVVVAQEVGDDAAAAGLAPAVGEPHVLQRKLRHAVHLEESAAALAVERRAGACAVHHQPRAVGQPDLAAAQRVAAAREQLDGGRRRLR